MGCKFDGCTQRLQAKRRWALPSKVHCKARVSPQPRRRRSWFPVSDGACQVGRKGLGVFRRLEGGKAIYLGIGRIDMGHDL